jgi:hypothetical protein
LRATSAAVAHLLPKIRGRLAPGRSALHRLPEFARVVDGRVVYDVGQLSLSED